MAFFLIIFKVLLLYGEETQDITAQGGRYKVTNL